MSGDGRGASGVPCSSASHPSRCCCLSRRGAHPRASEGLLGPPSSPFRRRALLPCCADPFSWRLLASAPVGAAPWCPLHLGRPSPVARVHLLAVFLQGWGGRPAPMFLPLGRNPRFGPFRIRRWKSSVLPPWRHC